MAKNILWFKQVRSSSVGQVGGKNASLGEMTKLLSRKNIPIPSGFAVTANAFQLFLTESAIKNKVWRTVEAIDVTNTQQLAEEGKKLRDMIMAVPMPEKLVKEITQAYTELCHQVKISNLKVAVRSSATAEDLPGASFAGQHDSFLNVGGAANVVVAVQKCFASLFTDRAISYRVNKKFKHRKVSMSVGVQMMVRSNNGASGVIFTIDTETGFPRVVQVDSSFGYGEAIVQGKVVPDHYVVFKDTLKTHRPIIEKKLGSKLLKFVSDEERGSVIVPTTPAERIEFSISDNEVLQLAKWAVEIEKMFGKPMDIEWAKDGVSKKLFIVQARPETVEAGKDQNVIETYRLAHRGKVITKGISVGAKIGVGRARLIKSPKQLSAFKEGDVLVTKMTDPAWEPIMKKAAAIVTDGGGRTSHAAIVSRELGVPCIVGTGDATKTVKDSEAITVSCAEGDIGFIYAGAIPFKIHKMNLAKIPKPPVAIMMNVGQPDTAFDLCRIPNDGVGLAREEFIIANAIGVHPMALVNFSKLKDHSLVNKIKKLTVGYNKPTDFYVEKLADGIARIGAAFYPKKVIVRFSDFKTNEYSTLLGGKDYEPKEENPMIGWRGASRYYDPDFEPAFLLECAAMLRVRDDMGLTNVIPMVPFCRTVEEGKKVLAVMKKAGLVQGKNGLQVYVMVEIPSNVLLAEKFADIFDGFSIGSNDLTQLTLGLDRDSPRLHAVADERDEAVVQLVKHVVAVARKKKIKIGICGQAPSDYPPFAAMLVKAGIDSLSLNPDSVLPARLALSKIKKTSKK
ncbi:MAG: phosphoenolpyruvate synthase [Patescibacteria group bacterium]|jgi:pyruvate,water dikinase